jgi:hypothetical protein
VEDVEGIATEGLSGEDVHLDEATALHDSFPLREFGSSMEFGKDRQSYRRRLTLLAGIPSGTDRGCDVEPRASPPIQFTARFSSNHSYLSRNAPAGSIPARCSGSVRRSQRTRDDRVQNPVADGPDLRSRGIWIV